MINYQEALFDAVSVHSLPGGQDSAHFILSDEPVPVTGDGLRDSFFHLFFHAFKEPEFYRFSHIEEDSNRMYSLARTIFSQPDSVHAVSIEIARHLNNQSSHPNIRKGDLIVAYMEDILIEDEMVQAIAIVKSESKESFIDIHNSAGRTTISLKQGIYPRKLDKACIIFNTASEEGFRLCVADKISSGEEAVYWKDRFLDVERETNNYHNTKVYIQATKSFIDERLKPMYDIEKQDEAQLLSSSRHYFETHEDFDEGGYLDSLFGDQEEIKSEFKEYQTEQNIQRDEQFQVSQAAVKKQSRVFKSVIKLDKNFHVYVHGNRDMIERGTDPDGRKFYKLYYDREA